MYLHIYVSACTPGEIQGSYYKGNGVTDNNVYTYITCKSS